MTTKDRLDKLAAALRLQNNSQSKSVSLPEIMAKAESVLELPAGSLSRTPEEAYTKGFESMAGELAACLGMTSQELKEFLKNG